MNAMPHHPPAPRRAFTLVELAMVLAIVAVLGVIAAPRFHLAQDRYAADAAARRLAANLDWARRQAVAESKAKNVYFDVTANAYWLYGVDALDDGAADERVSLGKPPHPAKLVSALGKLDNATVTFSGYGAPDLGGDVVITVGGEMRTVIIDPQTGKAVVK